MTVKELVEKLQKLNQEDEVIFSDNIVGIKHYLDITKITRIDNTTIIGLH